MHDLEGAIQLRDNSLRKSGARLPSICNRGLAAFCTSVEALSSDQTVGSASSGCSPPIHGASCRPAVSARLCSLRGEVVPN